MTGRGEDADSHTDPSADTAEPDDVIDDTPSDADPDALAAICDAPSPSGWHVADFDLDFCADRPDCFITDGTPPGCPNACSCLCYGGVVYYQSCTLIYCPDEGPCFCCSDASD